MFFIEGLRFLAQALQQRVPLRTVLVVPKMLVHPFGHTLMRQVAQQKIPVLEVTPDVFLSHSRAEEPQWIGAIAEQQWEPLARLGSNEGLCWVACDTVHSPGNLGNIIRTCDAVGAAGLILLGDAVDPYDPATVRATMGAIFSVRFARTTPLLFTDWLRRQGATLVGTSPHAPQDYQQVRYPRPLVVWMGGERQGLSPEQQNACNLMVRIPMAGRSDSLNVAVATGVMLYEVFNQQRAGT